MKQAFLVALALLAMGTAQASQRIDLHRIDPATLAKGQASSTTKRHETMLGMGAASTLHRLALAKDPNGVAHYRYQQMFRGIPVFGQNIIVSQKPDGHIDNLFGQLVEGLEGEIPDMPARITPARAMATARAAWPGRGAGGHTSREENKQVIYMASDGHAHLGYLVTFFMDSIRGGQPSRPFVVVDGQTGKILKQWDGLTTDAIGTGPGGNQKTGRYTWGGRRLYGYLDVAQNGSTCTMNNADVKSVDLGGGTSASTTAFSYPCPINTYKTINGAYSPINDAHAFGSVVQNMYRSWTGAPAISFQLIMRVHYGAAYENAFWDGKQMNFGDGASLFYPLVSADVAGHEISHGYTEQHSGLLYYGQSGAINEAFSDMAGEAAELFWKGRNDFLVGQDIMKATGAVRYICNPTQDGRSIDNANNYTSALNVHLSSGVYNKAFCNLATTTGWGTKKAFQVFARANALYWTPDSSFDTAACGVETAAADMGMNRYEVASAFSSVGVSCAGRKILMPSTGGVLTRGMVVHDIQARTGQAVHYTLEVPEGALMLTIAQWGGLGNSDLYVKRGSPPTNSSYDCLGAFPGNTESCRFPTPGPGTYYITMIARTTFSRVSLENSFTPPEPLTSGQVVALPPLAPGAQTVNYRLDVPAGSSKVVIKISGGTGNADLYVQQSHPPTQSSYLCRPALAGNNESCTFQPPAAGSYFIQVRSMTPSNGVSLKGTIWP